MISNKVINEAAFRIKDRIHHTPIFTSQYLNKLSGVSLHFKCENFQKTGSFKARGALNSVWQLSDKQKAAGVATHSSGNHGQALAWAAQQQNIKAFIVMPENAPAVKVEAVKGYGATVVFCESTLQGREQALAEVQQKTGAIFIPPYNFENTIAGQATCALEVFKELPMIDTLLCPVGGGGLLAGSALSAHFSAKQLEVWGCEPELASDAHASFKTGELQAAMPPITVADGLRTSLGPINFGYIKQFARGILLCSEEEIKAAQQLIWQRLKIVVEPSSAVPLACILKNPQHFKGKEVAVIITGGNVDFRTETGG